MYMKIKSFLSLVVLAAVLTLAGCERMPEEITADSIKEETLYLRADGSVQIAYVEDFTEKYYNTDELKGFIASELAAYNKAYGENAAVIGDISVSGGKVKAVLTFKNTAIYAEFNEKRGDKPVSFPSISKLKSEYGNTTFKSTKDDGSKSGNEIITEELTAVVVEGPLLLQTEKKMRYYSAGNMADANHIKLDEGVKAVVLFSK